MKIEHQLETGKVKYKYLALCCTIFQFGFRLFDYYYDENFYLMYFGMCLKLINIENLVGSATITGEINTYEFEAFLEIFALSISRQEKLHHRSTRLVLQIQHRNLMS